MGLNRPFNELADDQPRKSALITPRPSGRKLLDGNMFSNLLYITRGSHPRGINPTYDHFLSMSSSEATNSPQVNLLLSFFDAFRKIDLKLVGNHLHKDLRRLTYPKSLGRGEQTKEEYLQHAGKYMALWTECDVSHGSVYRSNLLLSGHHSLLFIPSQKLRGRSSFMCVI